ncbi:MAG TPA: IPT/TIG domain-containing protein [Bryobacteraceae bacterium]|nr:IPT/TIG domain-containing protein [Bryobacteraceae bacterium]
MKLAFGALALCLAAAGLADAQTWDTSGNNLLNGTYYFRETGYGLGDYVGDLQYAVSLYGNITFNGNGSYTMNATVYDSNGNYGSYSPSGTYAISASGYGYISSPVSQGALVYGLVSQGGIFIGSATEAYFDMFVAAPVASPAATTSTFKGPYWVAGMDLSGSGSGSPLYTSSFMYQISPDGAGNIPAFNISGYIGQNGTQVIPQTLGAVKYVFQNGAGVINYPVSNNAVFLDGQEYVYISSDGNFIFGGGPQAWDFFVGVRVGSGSPTFSGLFYQAGMDEDASTLSAGYATLDTYYGALDAISGSVIGHQRLQYSSAAAATVGVSGYTYSDSYALKSDGTYTNPTMRYAVGANGAIRIGSGIGPELGINVALAAPSVSGNGVFIFPTGVVNAASNAPFTAGLSPGELVTLYGQNLSDATHAAPSLPFPTTLGNNVQVKVNGTPAPIYFVSSGEISFLIPYGTNTSIAGIQVINNGTASNTVTLPVHITTPGVFTNPVGGLGTAAALHADYSLVNSAKPAQPGETIQVFVTGLGAVSPAVADGAAGPDNPLSTTSNTITAFINNQQATVTYAGLAPDLGGLYQVNLTVPTGLASGTYVLDISGPDSDSAIATIPVGTASSSSAEAPGPSFLAHRRGGAEKK